MTDTSTSSDEPTSTNPTCLPLDTSGYIRRARRLADLSQRDLAAAVGMAQSRVSRMEAGQRLSVDDFARVLAAAGLRIAIVDDHGTEVAPMPVDVLHDRAGRRRPAHLDSYSYPEKPTIKMLLHTAEPEKTWHHHREERDRRRERTGRDEHTEQLTVSVQRARRAARKPSTASTVSAAARMP